MKKMKEELCKRDGLEGLSRALGVEISVALEEHQPNFGPELEDLIRIHCGDDHAVLSIIDALGGEWDNMGWLDLPDGRRLLQTIRESDVMTDIITNAFSAVIPKNIKQFIVEEKNITDININKHDGSVITADLTINDSFLLQLGTDGQWSIPSDLEVDELKPDGRRSQRLAYIYIDEDRLAREVGAACALDESGNWLEED